jgi:hypothetical protein
LLYCILCHPPPLFITQILDNPLGQLLVLSLIVYTFDKHPLIGLFLGIAYLVSSYPTLEYMDESKTPEKEQPNLVHLKLIWHKLVN